MKKLISIILALSILLSSFLVLGINSFADSNYNKLYKESRKYVEGLYGNLYNPLCSPPLTVLLYTDAAKEFTFERHINNADIIVGINFNWFVYRGTSLNHLYPAECYLVSPEIYKATKKCRTEPYEARESRSALRECVKYFDISKDELVAAFKRMKEDPDYIRPLLSFLSDAEYESAKLEDGTFGKTDWPEFVIEAMYIKDDKKAHDLLTEKYAVYVPELKRTIEFHEVDTGENGGPGCINISQLIEFGLTSDSMGMFIKYLRNKVDNGEIRKISEERMLLLEAEREKQLANPKTGEPVYLVPVAIASLTFGVYAVYPRKKRKLEA